LVSKPVGRARTASFVPSEKVFNHGLAASRSWGGAIDVARMLPLVAVVS
jgi:hypothetical protein